jgi:hypothetical protein
MYGFTIGTINTGKKVDEFRDSTEVSLVDGGIQIYKRSWSMMGGGLGTYTPAQARELGQLLINAADRWTELNAQVQQSKAEIKAVERNVKNRIKDMLS